ncbi:hypothetical protein EVAR_23220_1 [Eumeta japonica]|uniref:Uncharacterized protein n=1 Tax=Eumeta variegata TaxID=151549 RepID=A0A4C1VCP9_EUMVA|nr:hypothetical protein EVAR_23220_1 [Eumeta japonica]
MLTTTPTSCHHDVPTYYREKFKESLIYLPNGWISEEWLLMSVRRPPYLPVDHVIQLSRDARAKHRPIVWATHEDHILFPGTFSSFIAHHLQRQITYDIDIVSHEVEVLMKTVQ